MTHLTFWKPSMFWEQWDISSLVRRHVWQERRKKETTKQKYNGLPCSIGRP